MTKTFKYAKSPQKGGGRGPKRGHHDPDVPRLANTNWNLLTLSYPVQQQPGAQDF